VGSGSGTFLKSKESIVSKHLIDLI